MVLEVNATSNESQSDLTEFDGLYVFTAARTQYSRPIWERPGDIEGQNVRYYLGNWIIHGSEHGVLAHASTAYFPPIEDSAAEWVHSTVVGDDSIRVWIRCIE